MTLKSPGLEYDLEGVYHYQRWSEQWEGLTSTGPDKPRKVNIWYQSILNKKKSITRRGSPIDNRPSTGWFHHRTEIRFGFFLVTHDM